MLGMISSLKNRPSQSGKNAHFFPSRFVPLQRIDRYIASRTKTEFRASQNPAEMARVETFFHEYDQLLSVTQKNLGVTESGEGLWEKAAKSIIAARDNKDRLLSYLAISKLLRRHQHKNPFAFVPSESFLRRLMKEADLLAQSRKLKDLIPVTSEIIEWKEETPLRQAMEAMDQHGFAQLVVRRNEHNRLALLTNNGINVYQASGTKRLDEMTVGEVVSQFEKRDTWTVFSPEHLFDAIRDAVKERVAIPGDPKKSQRKYWVLLVTDDGKVTGKPLAILTPRELDDLVKQCTISNRIWESECRKQTPEEKERVETFLTRYNALEAGLKARLHSEKGVGKLLVDAREIFPVVRDRYDELVELSWLRSEIVHNYEQTGEYDFVPDASFNRYFDQLVRDVLRPETLGEAFGKLIEPFSEHDSVREVCKIILEKRFGQVVVRDDTGSLRLVTHVGLNRLARYYGMPLAQTDAQVRDVLSHEPYDVIAFFKPNQSIESAREAFQELNLFKRRRYWAGLITEDGTERGKLLGIITPYDVATYDR